MVVASVGFAAGIDEGMFTPDRIATLGLKKKGLKIRPDEIYNPSGGGSLADAVIRLSVGCTAEFVSPEGLILTNHHCGFDALVSASTPGSDLVETGFKADNKAGEIPARDYSIFITERVDDVTAKVKAGTEGITGGALTSAWTKNADDLQKAEQAKAPAGSAIRIQSLNNGYFFFLYQTREINDIRMVYAPPRSIGIFGGDPDNFEWTRHTGDFTFLRAYAAPDGSAAKYSPENVPYKPKKFLTINIGGIKDSDFVFVLGYPGSTTRYRESQAIEFARDANFPFLARWLDARSSALRLIGESDEAKRIEFQSDIANYDNSRKLFEGGRLRLRRSNVVESRRAEEERFTRWIAQNPERERKYGTLLKQIAEASAESNASAFRDVIIRRIPDSTTPVFRQIFEAVIRPQMLPDAEREKKLAEIRDALKSREPVYEREMLKFFFSAFAELPEGQQFSGAEDRFGSLKGQARRDAEAKFAAGIAEGDYWTPENIAALYGPRTMEYRPERDDVLALASALRDARNEASARAAAFAARIDRLRLLYQQGMAEMKGTTPYPDANLTLRFTYGNVKGYNSREAEFRSPFTTIRGMLEKDTGVMPFDAPQRIKDLQAAGDFGRFGSGGSVVVNFISTTDIIGGNSGSPIFNGAGEQVGIVFDSNFEGLGNDFYYDPDKNRTISVDIRFVLFVTEKFGGAGWILDEMKLTGQPKTRAAAK